MSSSMTRLMVAIAALLVPACEASKSSPMVTLVEEEGYEEAWQQYRSAARPSPGGAWVVEGDLFFRSEDDMRAYFDQRMLEDVDKAHAYKRDDGSGYIPKFGFPAQRNIRYCVSNAFAPDKATWVTRVADAARAWEKIANVKFVYLSAFDGSCTAAQASVDFAVIPSAVLGYYACSKLLWPDMIVQCPTSNALGVLEIDTDVDVTDGGNNPNVTATGVLRHELGHILGLRHEHPYRGWMTPACPEMPDVASQDLTGEQLVSDVAYDPGSIMHYPTFVCGGNLSSDLTFTKTDVFSIQRLYDMPPSWVDNLNAVTLL